MTRFLYPALLTATLALAAALCLGPAAANKLLSIVGVADAQGPGPSGPVSPGGYGDNGQPLPGFNTSGPGSPYDRIITTAPTQPMPVAMPQNWAGASEATNANSAIRSQYVPPPGAPPAKPLESAIRIATVGPEVILASDMNRYQAYLTDQANGAPPEQLAAERQELVKELKNIIDVKLLVVDATNTIPPEGIKDFQGKFNEAFEKDQLKDMMARVKAKNPAELDAILHQIGSSLERKKQQLFEQTLAHEWLAEHSKSQHEIDFDAALAYYREHRDEFSFPAQARWEQLAALFANCNSRDDAWRLVAAMGNDVLKGPPTRFAEVAKAHSQGPTAANGGLRDWTTKGALVSKVLDGAIFSLPVRQMSQIIEDTDGFHIIRVIERRDAGVVPFTEAQAGIKKKLTEKQVEKNSTEFLDKLRNKTQIWTIFDDAPGSPPAGQLPPYQAPPAQAATGQIVPLATAPQGGYRQ